MYIADPTGGAVEDEGLHAITCWGDGFGSRRGHGCLSLVSVVCCQVEVSASGRSPDYGCVLVCGLDTSAMRRPRPALGYCAKEEEEEEEDIFISYRRCCHIMF
jgi:hypothetical protein